MRISVAAALLVTSSMAGRCETFHCPASGLTPGATVLKEMQVAAVTGKPYNTIMCMYNEGEPVFFEKPGPCSAVPTNWITDAPPTAAIQVCSARTGSVDDCAAVCASK